MCPINGPKKSQWIRLHALSGQGHGVKGAFGGFFLSSLQILHELTKCSISLSIPGHQT